MSTSLNVLSIKSLIFTIRSVTFNATIVLSKNKHICLPHLLFFHLGPFFQFLKCRMNIYLLTHPLSFEKRWKRMTIVLGN